MIRVDYFSRPDLAGGDLYYLASDRAEPRCFKIENDYLVIKVGFGKALDYAARDIIDAVSLEAIDYLYLLAVLFKSMAAFMASGKACATP